MERAVRAVERIKKMKGRIVVEFDEIPKDCYWCSQSDGYGFCHWVGKYVTRYIKVGERYPTCPIEPWEEGK